MTKHYLLFLFLVYINFTLCAQNISGIKIQELKRAEGTDKHLVISYCEDNLAFEKNGESIFNLSTHQNDTKAEGWICYNSKGIFVLVEVEDSLHVNTQTGSAIWDGDAIQFGIDANGDGVSGGNEEEIFIGPNDAMYAVALTGNGSESWAHYHGNSSRNGGNTMIVSDIKRINNTTVYKIFLPWDEFNWEAGLSDLIGLSFMINDTDEGLGQTRLTWGGGVGSQLRPGLFMKARLQPSPNNLLTSVLLNSEVWTSWDNYNVIIASNSNEEIPVKLFTNSKEMSFELNSQNSGLKRFLVSVPHYLLSTNLKLKIGNKDYDWNVTKNLNKQVELTEVIDTKITETGNELYIRNLLSVKSLILSEYNKAILSINTNRKIIKKWIEYSTVIVKEYTENKITAESLMNSSDDCVLVFNSSTDNTLQFYRLLLPKNYKNGKSYPLIVDLHGSGNPYSLAFISNYHEYAENSNIKQNLVEAFILYPWGRGNLGYLGSAGDDIYDAINDVEKLFNIDENRIYLTGMSMGGWGTWYHALKSPDIWAAIAPCAASMFRGEDIPAAVGNISDLPVWIWHGEKDGAVSASNAYMMKEALDEIGNKAKFTIIPERGHQIKQSEKLDIYKWLLQHSRKIAHKSFYKCFDKSFQGTELVKIRNASFIDENPYFKMTAEKETIRLETKNILEIEANLLLLDAYYKGVNKLYINDELRYNSQFDKKETFNLNRN